MTNHPNRSVNGKQEQEVGKVHRSFPGIRSALFDDWDRLRQGKISTENARASSRMADSILSTVHTELMNVKFSKTQGMAPLLLDDKAGKLLDSDR